MLASLVAELLFFPNLTLPGNVKTSSRSFGLISRISSHPAVFFSHNKPANSIFSHNKTSETNRVLASV
jgi:hypothetical protein